MAIFGKKSVVGIELDSNEIRAVELSGETGKPRLTAWGRVPLPEGAVNDGQIVSVDAVREALNTLKVSSGIGQSEVLLGVLNQGVLVRLANYPMVEKEKQDGMIRMQAQDFMPLPLNTVILDYAVVSPDDAEQLEVLLVAGRRDMIGSFVNAFSDTRWKMKDIDVSALVLTRVMPTEMIGKTVAVVDLANGMTGLMISAQGMPRLVRLLSVRLGELAKMKGTSVQDILERTSANDDEITKWLESLTNEIRSSINYYHGQQSKHRVESILLTGRGSRLRGLKEALSVGLGMPVDAAEPFYHGGIDTHRDDVITQEAADFSAAISLALRGLEV
jgi:type IV pilus assembly protein PilM